MNRKRKQRETNPETRHTLKLARFISLSGLCSRRTAERMISDGRVEVNGDTVTNVAERVRPAADRILVDGSELALPARFTYVMLNKPPGYVCSRVTRGQRRSIYDLLPGSYAKLNYAGRLDADSEGALLLTDDGELIHRYTHPRFKQPKFYLVKTRGVPSKTSVRKLERGIELEDGVTRPCSVTLWRKGNEWAWYRVELREGRKRQIRRMFGAIGYEVERLKRTGVGPLELGTLSSGEMRVLSPREISELRERVGLRNDNA